MALNYYEEQPSGSQGLGGQIQTGESAGYYAKPNSSLAMLDLKRQVDREGMADEIRQSERDIILARQAEEQGRQMQLEDARRFGQEEAIRNMSSRPGNLGPEQGQDINSYLVNGLQNGSLAPEEAMAAIEEPSVDPRVKAELSKALGIEPRGLGSVPQRR